jgi:adenine-specific DNA-methyltransferase
MNTALELLDITRQKASKAIPTKTKSELGQYMTPSRIADFMASLFATRAATEIRLLDAGAGIGSLSVAFFERLLEKSVVSNVTWIGYELDRNLATYLKDHIQAYKQEFQTVNIEFNYELRTVDFIEDAVKRILFGRQAKFNFAILNPPYKKINSRSRHRLLLRELKIETVNLYTAFVALVVDLLEDSGQVVAIIPRSFCNGPYYKSFRERLLRNTAIRHIHIFDARDKAFSDEEVLQENIIVLLEKNGKQGKVKISKSTDGEFSDYQENNYLFDQIVSPQDTEKFIHIPTQDDSEQNEFLKVFRYSLKEIGLEVSTGPVVDFRLKDYLRPVPEKNTVPLIYPGHFNSGEIGWPKIGLKKPNALVFCDETKKRLFPNGFYVVVRRFSSKEERRRIVVNILNPDDFSLYDWLGFENHLNVYHVDKRGLSESVSRGLATYLNSTFADQYFRQFSGHTQVNATDLRLLKYPSLNILHKLGEWAMTQKIIDQDSIDEEIRKHAK